MWYWEKKKTCPSATSSSGTGTGFFFSQYFGFSPVSIIPPMIHTHLHLHIALIRRIRRAKPGNLPKSNSLSEVKEHWIEKCCNLFYALGGSNNESSTQARVWVRDISVGIATCCGLDGPEFESRWGTRFSAPVQNGAGALPAPCTIGAGSLSRG